jgi:hypothetical protein
VDNKTASRLQAATTATITGRTILTNSDPAFTPQEIVQALHILHAQIVDHHESLLLWMPISLEDMADLVTRAIKITEPSND